MYLVNGLQHDITGFNDLHNDKENKLFKYDEYSIFKMKRDSNKETQRKNKGQRYKVNKLSPTRNININTAQVKITGHNHRRNYLSH